MRACDLAGLSRHVTRSRTPSIRAASGHGHQDPAAPSAPPLPKELRTSERIQYPEVYSDNQDGLGAAGLAGGQGPVNDSVLSTDQVQVWSHLGLHLHAGAFSEEILILCTV